MAKDTGMATSILATGIMAKSPKRGHGELACECVVKMTRAAIASDSQGASKLVDMASSMRPDCADAPEQSVGDHGEPRCARPLQHG